VLSYRNKIESIYDEIAAPLKERKPINNSGNGKKAVGAGGKTGREVL